MAPTAPNEIWRGAPLAAEVIADDARSHAVAPGFRVFRASQWTPREWKITSSPDRQVEALAWDHATLYPKYHLQAPIPLVETQGSLAAADFKAFLDVARAHGLLRPDGVREPAREALDLLGANYAVFPGDAIFPGGERLAASRGPGNLADAAAWRSATALPRAWVAPHVQQLPKLTEESPSALRRRTRETLWKNGRWRDFRQEAVVETDTVLPKAATSRSSESESPAPAATCRLVADEPARVVFDVELPQAGLLVVSDHYDPDWRAAYLAQGEATPRSLTILRTNRVLRGVWLPPGRGRVTFVYRPTPFYVGAALSAAAWLGWLIATAIGWRRNKLKR
jgi:hypothetical protein